MKKSLQHFPSHAVAARLAEQKSKHYLASPGDKPSSKPKMPVFNAPPMNYKCDRVRDEEERRTAEPPKKARRHIRSSVPQLGEFAFEAGERTTLPADLDLDTLKEVIETDLFATPAKLMDKGKAVDKSIKQKLFADESTMGESSGSSNMVDSTMFISTDGKAENGKTGSEDDSSAVYLSSNAASHTDSSAVKVSKENQQGGHSDTKKGVLQKLWGFVGSRRSSSSSDKSVKKQSKIPFKKVSQAAADKQKKSAGWFGMGKASTDKKNGDAEMSSPELINTSEGSSPGKANVKRTGTCFGKKVKKGGAIAAIAAAAITAAAVKPSDKNHKSKLRRTCSINGPRHQELMTSSSDLGSEGFRVYRPTMFNASLSKELAEFEERRLAAVDQAMSCANMTSLAPPTLASGRLSPENDPSSLAIRARRLAQRTSNAALSSPCMSSPIQWHDDEEEYAASDEASVTSVQRKGQALLDKIAAESDDEGGVSIIRTPAGAKTTKGAVVESNTPRKRLVSRFISKDDLEVEENTATLLEKGKKREHRLASLTPQEKVEVERFCKSLEEEMDKVA